MAEVDPASSRDKGGAFAALQRTADGIAVIATYLAALCLASLVAMVLAEVLWGGYPPVQWDAHALGMVVYVALGPALLAYICWQRAVALTGSQLPMFFLNLTPVFAAILAVLLLGEFPKSYHYIGLVLIVVGIVLSNRDEAVTNIKK